ncbi:MAG: pyruvate kinase, partial [Aureliella sp.]
MSTAGLQVDGARSKIVATVGPACDTVEMLVELIRQGVDVFRINAAHGNQADYAQWLKKIEQARQITGIPVGVLLDLSGPKIRLGRLAQDPLEVEAGQELTIVRGEESTEPMQLCSNYGKLIDEIKVNDSIMLA